MRWPGSRSRAGGARGAEGAARPGRLEGAPGGDASTGDPSTRGASTSGGQTSGAQTGDDSTGSSHAGDAPTGPSGTVSSSTSLAVSVRGLTIGSRAGTLVRGIDLDVPAGSAVGLVGESGSGKSLTLRAVIGLLPRGVEVTGGSIAVTGRLGMVFQDPSSALDPLVTVGSQVIEVCRHVRGMSRDAARHRAVELFAEVGIPDPEQRLRSYPHELSGGQRQRVVLAVALAAEPDILLCDEPTTALDVTVQAQVLALVERLRVDRGLTVLFVSHDLAVVSQVCSTVSVMQAGQIVESGTVDQVVGSPQHPYTRTLLDAVLEIPEGAEG